MRKAVEAGQKVAGGHGDGGELGHDQARRINGRQGSTGAVEVVAGGLGELAASSVIGHAGLLK